MYLHIHYKEIVGFLNFTRCALMYVSLFIESNSSNALNHIDVVSKSNLLNYSKILLISPT
jgi:hypothetical protein